MSTASPLATLYERPHEIVPMGLELPPAPDMSLPTFDRISLPSFHLPEVVLRMPNVHPGAVLATTGALALALVPALAERADGATDPSKTCPKPAGSLSSSRSAPNPGIPEQVPGPIGVAIRTTSLGVEGGYGCVSDGQTVGFLAENLGDTTATDLRVFLGSQRGLDIKSGGVRVNGQPLLAGQCDFSFGNSVQCKIDDAFLPGEQAYIDVDTKMNTTGLGTLSAMVVGSVTEHNNDDNIAEQIVEVLADPVVPPPKSALGLPKISYTDIFRPGAKKGQKICRTWNFIVRIGANQPPAFNAQAQLSPKGNIKFRTGLRSYGKQVSMGDISRSRFGSPTVKACTVGKRAVVGFARISSENTDPYTVRIALNNNTGKSNVRRTKAPSGIRPGKPIVPSASQPVATR